jgi:hypothetical protein
MIDAIDPTVSFYDAELGDGDILCYQKELSHAE